VPGTGRRAAGLAGAAAALLAAIASPALAHDGRPIEPHDLWAAWSWEPATVTALAVAALLYARASALLRRRSANGRRARAVQSLGFWAGWALLVVALVSPLHRLGGATFAAHMVQHELLVALAAPLLVLARPAPALLWALPAGWRRPVGRATRGPTTRAAWAALTHPLVAFLLQAAALWSWHLPGPYQATLRSELAHALQHASFLLAASLFWWSVLHPPGRRGGGAALGSLFGTTIHTGALGALLALAERPWYPDYGRTAWAWGLTPLEDQQLAGLVMWIPACLAYIVAALWIARGFLVEPAPRGRAPAPALARSDA
jgi:cytochrome c oxidase assembly factor CtaG